MSTEAYVGEIEVYAFTYAPRGDYFCGGQLISIVDDQVLYSLIGTLYGGDGRVSFGVPDLRGREMVGVGAGPGLSNVYLSELRGWEAAFVPLPDHVHTASFSPSAETGGAQTYPVVGGVTAYPMSVQGDAPLSASTVVQGDNSVGAVAAPPAGGHRAVPQDNFNNALRSYRTAPGSNPVALAASAVTGTAATDAMAVRAPDIFFDLSVTASSGGGGGTVAINSAGTAEPTMSLLPPQLGLICTIAGEDYDYPPRP